MSAPLLFALLIAAEPGLAAPKSKIVGRLGGLPARTPAVVAATFPNYAGCPFTPLIQVNAAAGEAAFDPKRLASGGAVVFTFQERQDEDEGDETQGLVNRAGAVTSWTVTFTPAD